MQILQNTFSNIVSNLQYRIKPSDRNDFKLQNNLNCDTFEIQSQPKSDVKEHIIGMKFMLAHAQRLKPLEREAMLIKAINMENSYKQEHPDYYIDYRPFKELGDVYLYKENMPSEALECYENAIDTLVEYINDKEKTDIHTLKEIATKCKIERDKVEKYCADLREFNGKNFIEKAGSKKPEPPQESMEYLKNHSEEVKLYKKVKELGEMYESIGKCYSAMDIKNAYKIYLTVARDFLRGDERADIILKRRSQGLSYFMDLYQKN